MRMTAFLVAVTLLFPVASSVAAPLRVVAATTDLESIVKSVGGDLVQTSSIAASGQDAHFIEAKPSLMLRLRQADLFVVAGMELGIGWEEPLLRGSRNGRILPGRPGHLDASEEVRRLEVPAGAIDRSMGDIHALGNPHWWLDPWNGRQAAGTVSRRLGELSPDDRATFEANLAAFRRRIDEAMFGPALVEALGGDAAWRLALEGDPAAGLRRLSAARPGLPQLGGWAQAMAPHAGRPVITYHRSWSYLLDRFGLRLLGEIEPKPGIPPTPSHVLQLVERARQDRVGAILAEPWYASEAPALIAARTQAPLLRLALSTGGNADGHDYVAHLDHVVRAVAAALSATPPEG